MKTINQNHPTPPLSPNTIVIVSGLPRSGTSMMMKMLAAGGMEVMVDNIRFPDQDNPKGYYEYEKVKALPDGENQWLADAVGKVVKIIAFYIPHLPDTYHYKIVFMQRDISEILASQYAMVTNREEKPKEFNVELMTGIYEKHLQQIGEWIEQHKNIEKLDVHHHDLIFDPVPQIDRINKYLDYRLDLEKMQQAIDPTLYRQRKSKR